MQLTSRAYLTSDIDFFFFQMSFIKRSNDVVAKVSKLFYTALTVVVEPTTANLGLSCSTDSTLITVGMVE